MPLPLLPGLQVGAPAPSVDDDSSAPASGLADFIAGLDDSQIQQLVAAADEWAAANPEEGATEGDPAEEAADDEAPTDVDASDTIPAPPLEGDEDAPPADDEAPADEDVEPSADDLEAVSAQADVDAGEAAASIQAMQDLADEDSPLAPTVDKIVGIAGKLNEALLKSQKLLDRAVSKEDVQAAAQAGIDCRQYLEAIQALQQAAQMMSSGMQAPAMTPKDHPALQAWSAKTQGRTLLPAL